VAIAVVLKKIYISVGCLKIRAGIIKRHNFYPRKRNYNNEEATQKEEA